MISNTEEMKEGSGEEGGGYRINGKRFEILRSFYFVSLTVFFVCFTA